MPTENSIPEILVLHSDKKDEDGVKADVLGVTTSTLSEPVVTMRELLAYYCEFHGGFPLPCSDLNSSSSVYYYGGSVRPLIFYLI